MSDGRRGVKRRAQDSPPRLLSIMLRLGPLAAGRDFCDFGRAVFLAQLDRDSRPLFGMLDAFRALRDLQRLHAFLGLEQDLIFRAVHFLHRPF